MAHKFDPINFHKLENPERYLELPPEKTLLKLGAAEGMKSLDIGAGTGFFSFALAKIVGPHSIVYSTDISEIMLNEIRNKAKIRNITSIYTILSNEDEIGINEKVDFVNIGFVLHEFNEPKHYLQKVFDLQNPGGRLAIIDWKKKETPKGPPLHHRISEDRCAEILLQIGYHEVEIIDIHENFYAVKAIKK